MIKRVQRVLKKLLGFKPTKFDATGERVDIVFNNEIDFETLDMYQKSHFRRYEFATKLLNDNEACGDFACGTGYGSVMLSKKAKNVIGADLNDQVIKAVKKRYRRVNNVEFIHANLLNLKYEHYFDKIFSFETVEHFSENDILSVLKIFHRALKPGGSFVFSTPYLQEKSDAAIKLGHHQTFYIDEQKIEQWLVATGFTLKEYYYQNYDTHDIEVDLSHRDFIICVAVK
ncbi:class I SAM-dependent methyltransferase [Flavitalea sp.]|nr:class I SAM-dependent methyltransferase [Flavitalea sp.]